MPGMNSGLDSTNPTITAAFRSALLHQGIIILLVLAALALAWVCAREATPRAAAGRAARSEPAWRRVLRIGFGIIWLFDALLQAQPGIPAGLPSQGIEPAAARSPSWVQHLVNWGVTSWSYHPVQMAAAAVWVQAGIGLWLLVAPRGLASRLAGLASIGWGLVVWVFGESFGGIFAPGLSWLTGAPGAALFYCAAGVLIVLPERRWRSPQIGRAILTVLGVFFIGMAVLQAWPGRGFWQGSLHGALASMVSSMAATPQPALLAGWVANFASFTAAHPVAVNLYTVIALAATGAGLLSGASGWTRTWLLQGTIIATVALCLAVWVLFQDFGFFGGVSTDPNSMIPIALIAVAGYLALNPGPPPEAAPAPAVQDTELAGTEPAGTVPNSTEPAGTVPNSTEPAGTGGTPEPGTAGWRGRIRPARLVRSFGAAGAGAVLATWAVVIILVGAAPMAAAQTSRTADPIIAQALDGSSAPLNYPAPSFRLTDQYGNEVSLASLHGKVVLLTFLDPVCTSDCPVIAQEFRQADQMLGESSRVELVAVVANPLYRSVAYTRAFDSQERLTGLRNWLFLTGNLAQLQQVWKNYGISAQIIPAGGMIDHSDAAYVIGANGNARTEFNLAPGSATSVSESSFAAELSADARQLLRSS